MAVDFRLIIFRPFKGEIITGQIVGATDGGIKGTIALPSKLWSSAKVFSVSLGFFDDIWVPKHLLHADSKLYEDLFAAFLGWSALLMLLLLVQHRR